ncbi:uncharacterized protein LOC143188794 isoform X2 [Calliopsis andreniformis]|uniref:uncharacterized protein LOC143188794 isoform X2 n=1 Tax=Calliopsis andreniformis TaxID=337506 RepID=UPI003FCD1DA4
MALRICQIRDSELGTQLRRSGSLRIPKSSNTTVDRSRSHVSSYDGKSSLFAKWAPDKSDAPPARPARHSAPAIDAPAPEYLARNLLQLGCPVVSMPTPRGGVGSEPPQSSDSDDYSTAHGLHQQQGGHGHGQGQVDVFNVPKVHVSGPPNNDESSSVINGPLPSSQARDNTMEFETRGLIDFCFSSSPVTRARSAGSIGARSAPSTPLQVAPGGQQASQQSISGSQLTVAAASQPPRSPSHAALRCNDSHLSKPLSRSTPSMAAGGVVQTPGTVSKSSSTSSPTTTSSARQKKFHRHFSQVAADERVLNYYSCALVGDILLQGHLYITPNYFAFYSNVFGYVTKLLIPTVSVLKISKEKTARIIPNAVAIATEEDRHVFCSLLSRDSTFKLMKQVWDAAMEPQPLPEILPLATEQKDDSEVNLEEDDSSMSESGTDLNLRPPVVCTEADSASPPITRPSLPPPPPKVDPPTVPLLPAAPSKSKPYWSLLPGGLKASTVITILIALLAALYVSAALMMIRIDRLHTAYVNHPLVSPERFTQERLLHYLNTNLEQIIKVRQSLQTLSQQFVTMSRSSETDPAMSAGAIEPEDAPS